MKEVTSTRDVSAMVVVDIWKVISKTLKNTDVYSLLRLIDASLYFLQTHHLKASVGHHLRLTARPWISSIWEEKQRLIKDFKDFEHRVEEWDRASEDETEFVQELLAKNSALPAAWTPRFDW